MFGCLWGIFNRFLSEKYEYVFTFEEKLVKAGKTLLRIALGALHHKIAFKALGVNETSHHEVLRQSELWRIVEQLNQLR